MSSVVAPDVLREWDGLLLRVSEGERDEIARPVREAGTVLRGPADESAVVELEARLGVALPPSYRSFLLRSDGAWAQPGWGLVGSYHPPDTGNGLAGLGLLDAAQVGWFRDREPSYVADWTLGPSLDGLPGHPAFRPPVREVQYLDHERSAEENKVGHLWYALQVSSDFDGYTILLNPLVVDPSGEWEAWDFGSKTLGGTRYPSFSSLLAADLRQLRQQLDRRAMTVGPEALERTARDEAAQDTDRFGAVAGLCHAGEGRRIVDLLLAYADPSVEIGRRQQALQLLGRVGDERALSALIAASMDPQPRIRSAVLGDLAANPHPQARAAAVSLLIADESTIGAVSPLGADAVYEAWSITGSTVLLEKLAYCGDRRAVAPLARALLDTGIPAEQYSRLLWYAAWPGDPALVPALIAAADLPDPPLQAIGEALLGLGAKDDAIPVLARALTGYLLAGQVAERLGELNHPLAIVVLVEQCRIQPTEAILRALGWTQDQAALAALTAVATDSHATPELRLAAIDGLEKMRGIPSADALALLAGQGSLDAARALARRRDNRALPYLTGLLDSTDDDLTFEAVDGLRDLRELASAPALLDTVIRHTNPDIIAAAASEVCPSHRTVTKHRRILS